MVGIVSCAQAVDSTINTNNKWAWCPSTGWINCRTDDTNGAVIGEFVCSGYFYSPSTGWIHLGDGNPTNGIRYTNVGTNDYGVNHDGKGNLRGSAWSGSAGWVYFVSNGTPKVDLRTGILTGYAWGDSVGWMSFSNVQAYLESDTMYSGPDTDSDNIPDAWELNETGSTNILGSGHDEDNDGVSDVNEYISGTCPTNAGEYLKLIAVSSTNGADVELTWSSEETRVYRIEKNSSLTNGGDWTESEWGLLSPDSGFNTTRALSIGATTQGFFRVKASLPVP